MKTCDECGKQCGQWYYTETTFKGHVNEKQWCFCSMECHRVFVKRLMR